MQFLVEGESLAYKLEPDGDVHVIIGSDHATMVAEFPVASCVPRIAARPVLDAARNQLLSILPTLPDSTVRELGSRRSWPPPSVAYGESHEAQGGPKSSEC